MGEDVEPVGLAEAIAQIRAELVAAIQEGAGSRQVPTWPIELEFQVDVTRSKGASGGVKVSVISLGAQGRRDRTDTNRVMVTLTPWATGAMRSWWVTSAGSSPRSSEVEKWMRPASCAPGSVGIRRAVATHSARDTSSHPASS